jgi:excisionase family DNA binding protein
MPVPEFRIATTAATASESLAREEELMDKLLLTPEEVAEALGIGRTKVYELIRLGFIESVKIDGCRRIPTVAAHEYVARLRREAAA